MGVSQSQLCLLPGITNQMFSLSEELCSTSACPCGGQPKWINWGITSLQSCLPCYRWVRHTRLHVHCSDIAYPSLLTPYPHPLPSPSPLTLTPTPHPTPHPSPPPLIPTPHPHSSPLTPTPHPHLHPSPPLLTLTPTPHPHPHPSPPLHRQC